VSTPRSRSAAICAATQSYLPHQMGKPILMKPRSQVTGIPLHFHRKIIARHSWPSSRPRLPQESPTVTRQEKRNDQATTNSKLPSVQFGSACTVLRRAERRRQAEIICIYGWAESGVPSHVTRSPSARLVRGSHPSSRERTSVLSELRPLTPSGPSVCLTLTCLPLVVCVCRCAPHPPRPIVDFLSRPDVQHR
jgi:hypothetical protein